MGKGPKDKLSDVKRVHRRFLYLDGDEVLPSPASLRGGDVTEVREESKEAGGTPGGRGAMAAQSDSGTERAVLRSDHTLEGDRHGR